MPENSFGYVPTPALVAPIEFTMPRAEYEGLGGYTDPIRQLEELGEIDRLQVRAWHEVGPWPAAPLGGAPA
jgi:hypothetical protein